MTIDSAQYGAPDNTVVRVVIDGAALLVPADPANRHFRRLQAAGIAIGPYAAPPAPSDDERIDEAFPQTDVAVVLAKALLDHENRLRALEGKPAIAMAQLKTALKALLP